VANLYIVIYKQRETIPLVLRLLSLLRPQLHHQIHQPINSKHEHHHQARIPPTEILLVQVQRAQVVRTSRVLADLASDSVVGVEQVCSAAHAALVSGKVFLAGLAGWGVKEGDFVGFAGYGLVPGCEDHEAGHEVVEGIEVVEPGRGLC